MDLAELTRKASAGICASQATLGLRYLYGYGPMEVDYQQAFRWLSLASEQGASRAIVGLADMYAQGLGIIQNIQKAVALYESVGRIEFFAALALGRIYSQGLGVSADEQKALKWYAVATAFEEPNFNYEGLSNELDEAKQYIGLFKKVG